MNVDDLARRIDAVSAQIVDVRDRFRSIDPHDRGGVATSVARLHDLLGDLLASESRLSVQQTALQEQQAVRETELQQYRDLFELVPVAILMTDLAGVIEQANRAATDLLGVPVDSLIGESLVVFVAERSARAELSAELVRLGTAAQSTFEYEVRVRARGGAFPALVTVSAARGPAGAVAGLHWLMRRRGAAESPPGVLEDGSRLELRAVPYGAAVTGAEADHRPLSLVGAEAADCPYRRLFDAAVDAIVLFDPDRRLADANPAAHELLGYGRHEIGHVRLDDLVARDAEQLGAIMAHLQRDGAWRGELELRRKDGGTVPVDAAVATVALPTSVAFGAGLRDITDRRRLQYGRERRRREVLSMVGHELLDALNGILLHAEILKMTGRYRRRSVDAIIASAHREQRLIEDLLDLARTDAGGLSLRPSRVDPLELLRSCISSCQATASMHVLRLDAPARMPAGRWDRIRLEQVCHNLLANAVKYSPAGGEILVRVEDLGDRARVSVADPGVGIAADALPRVFDRYFRAGPDDGPGGLGLGLYIARVLVEAHGGTISAESELGRGSVFRVTLPYEWAVRDG